MTAEAKMRQLARQDATLQSYFFTNSQVRWFDTQMPPNYVQRGTCAVVTRISTYRMHLKETNNRRSLCNLAQPKFQIDVLDLDPERARSACTAIMDWFATVDFSSDSQFASPVTSPNRHPNFILDGPTPGLIAETQPPVWRMRMDVRIFDLEE